MPRLPADIRISLKRRGGKTCRIELVRNPFKQRFWVRRDGRQSAKMPEATATQIGLETDTPVYVLKRGKIVDLTKERRKHDKREG